jgi:hypothetical protein
MTQQIREALALILAGVHEAADKLSRLNESGNVRNDGERAVSELRVLVSQLAERLTDADKLAENTQAAPVDLQLSALTAEVQALNTAFGGVVDLVGQLHKLAGDLQSAVVKA